MTRRDAATIARYIMQGSGLGDSQAAAMWTR